METGSQENTSFVLRWRLLWVSQKAGFHDLEAPRVQLILQIKFRALLKRKKQKQNIYSQSFICLEFFPIFKGLSSDKLPGTVHYLLSVVKQTVWAGMCLLCDDTIALKRSLWWMGHRKEQFPDERPLHQHAVIHFKDCIKNLCILAFCFIYKKPPKNGSKHFVPHTTLITFTSFHVHLLSFVCRDLFCHS